MMGILGILARGLGSKAGQRALAGAGAMLGGASGAASGYNYAMQRGSPQAEALGLGLLSGAEGAVLGVPGGAGLNLLVKPAVGAYLGDMNARFPQAFDQITGGGEPQKMAQRLLVAAQRAGAQSEDDIMQLGQQLGFPEEVQMAAIMSLRQGGAAAPGGGQY